MTNRQIISIVILLLCGVAFYAISLQTGDGEAAAFEGASMMPNLAVSLIFTFTLVELVLSRLRKRHIATGGRHGHDDDVNLGRSQLGSVLVVSGLLTLFALILLPAGYLLAGFLLVVGNMLITGGRNTVTIVVIATVATIVLYLGLHYGFGIHINAFPQLSS